jgi:signal recognition particle receptor subunit beta
MVFPLINTVLIITITTVILIIIYKLFFDKSKKSKKNNIMIIGPSGSGKTTFFYFLLGHKNIKTVASMQINKVKNFASQILSNINTYDITDIPGTGYFKEKIIDLLPTSIITLLFIDSTQKNSIVQAAEYLYDILNSDKYNEDIHLCICCNKQDGDFPKSKKMIENELNKEIENLIKIKQKNNLEEKEQFGTLFQMKGKFAMKNFNNVSFLETDVKSEYATVVKKIKDVLELEK